MLVGIANFNNLGVENHIWLPFSSVRHWCDLQVARCRMCSNWGNVGWGFNPDKIVFGLLASGGWCWSRGSSALFTTEFLGRNHIQVWRCRLLSCGNGIWSRIWGGMGEILSKDLKFRIRCRSPLSACQAVKKERLLESFHRNRTGPFREKLRIPTRKTLLQMVWPRALQGRNKISLHLKNRMRMVVILTTENQRPAFLKFPLVP